MIFATVQSPVKAGEERFPVIMAIMWLMMIVEQFRESRKKNQKYKVTYEVPCRVISRVFQFSGPIRVSKFVQECTTFEFIIGMRICAEERSAVVLVGVAINQCIDVLAVDSMDQEK